MKKNGVYVHVVFFLFSEFWVHQMGRGLTPRTLDTPLHGFATVRGCQFSDFSRISDFFRIKETGIKLIKYGQNMHNISIVSKDRLDSDKRLDIPSQNTVSKH